MIAPPFEWLKRFHFTRFLLAMTLSQATLLRRDALVGNAKNKI